MGTTGSRRPRQQTGPCRLCGQLPCVHGRAHAEALLRARFAAAVHDPELAPRPVPDSTTYRHPARVVYRSVRQVAESLGAQVAGADEQALWMRLVNPLHDFLQPPEPLTVTVVAGPRGTLVEVRPVGCDGRAFRTCANLLLEETSRLLGHRPAS